jgi:hypothetical protein
MRAIIILLMGLLGAEVSFAQDPKPLCLEAEGIGTGCAVYPRKACDRPRPCPDRGACDYYRAPKYYYRFDMKALIPACASRGTPPPCTGSGDTRQCPEGPCLKWLKPACRRKCDVCTSVYTVNDAPLHGTPGCPPICCADCAGTFEVGGLTYTHTRKKYQACPADMMCPSQVAAPDGTMVDVDIMPDDTCPTLPVLQPEPECERN